MGSPFRYSWPTMATLWKHKNGRYYVLWRDQGKPRQKSLKTTDKRIATRLFNNFQRDLIAGKIKPISIGIRQTLFPFVDEFLEYVSTVTEVSTYRLYDVALQKAKASWGDIPLNHITPRHVDTLITDMARAGLKPPTINKNYRHTKAALRKAYEWKYLSTTIRFPKPIKEIEQVRYLTKEELSRLMVKIRDQEFAEFCWFAAYTGLRSGEIIRLQWSDMDNPERDVMRISPHQKNKTEAWIPINRSARAILSQCKRRKGPKPFRFQSRTWVSQKFKRYAREAGLLDARFHDLRHTYGSHLAMSGENEVVIQNLMRHKSMASTLIYTKISMEYLKKASEKVSYGLRLVPNGNSKGEK